MKLALKPPNLWSSTVVW